MPLIEFKCKVCEKVQELLVRQKEFENPKCECGGDTKRLISKCSVKYGCNGFYSTDV